MKRAFVTGATSYVGAALCNELVNRGVHVTAVVRPTSDVRALRKEVVVTKTLDVLSADVVFHLATNYLRTHMSLQVAGLVDANVRFGALLLDAMARADVKHLVSAGSYFQFPKPINLYAATKCAFDAIVDYYVGAEGFVHTQLILYDVYGPGDRRKKLLNAMRDAQRSGISLPVPAEDVFLNLVYVTDAVEAFIRAAGLGAGRFAVTSGESRTIREVAVLFENLTLDVGGFDAPTTPSPRALFPPVPGWTPKVSLEEGIRNL